MNHSRRCARRGMTLTEVVVVLFIVVLVAAILLPKIGGVGHGPHQRAQSTAQVNALAIACESYMIQFRAAPGFLPESYWSTYSPGNFTSNQSVTLSLLGGTVAKGGTPIPGGSFGNFDPTLVGTGPIDGPRTYGAFYSPKASELIATNDTTGNAMPELVDPGTGVPLLYFRASKDATGKRTVDDATLNPPVGYFCRAANQKYLESKFGRYDQPAQSLLSTTGPGWAIPGGTLPAPSAAIATHNLSWTMASQSLSTAARANNGVNDGLGDIRRGDYVWHSAGPDGIYMAFDQLNNKSAAATNMITSFNDMNRFDDVSSSGGF